MKRTRDDMAIVWQTPANPPERHDYIFRHGIRYVRPYYFEFISHVKDRWARKTIVDLFTEEFTGRSRDYYVSAVKAGRLQVDGEMVPISYVVKSSQKISHFVHRHEPPVMALDIKILHKEEEVITVCKPASAPVHPCGQYRKNTIVGILQAEHALENYGLRSISFPLLHPIADYFNLKGLLDLTTSAVHRLDRLVSGLLILARTASRADLFRQQIESGLVQKHYIARVIGVFPENEQVVDANVNYDARAGRSSVEVRDDCRNNNNLLKGKHACTKFTRISTNGTHSIVLCKPITGRTHQIRVHLQHTGHPIANDTHYLSENGDRHSAGVTKVDSASTELNLSPDQNLDENANVISEKDFAFDPMCTNCPNLAPKGYDRHEEGLWLHCVKYSGPDWVYECPYPDWVVFS